MKLTSLLTLLAVPAALSLQDDKLGYQDTPLLPGTKWHVHDGLRPQPPVVTAGATLGAPPSDATVLFDGSSTDAWAGGPWAIEEGAMVVNGKGTVRTKERFGDCQLHIEWRAPAPKGDGQGRGNSGVFFFDRYEVQILDCFENQTYPDGMTSALYGQQPPMVNACRAPGEWQVYDIAFQAPRFDDAGKVVSPALVTLFHNGVLVHHGEALLGATRHRAVAEYSKHETTGPIGLQDHGNPMAFRNIWVRDVQRAQ
jgi:hypothetical protein